MSLTKFVDKGWLRPHKTSRQEIADLLGIVERDIHDSAEVRLSADWRFGIAYNAALKLCTILLYGEGYRTGHGSHHMRTIATLPHILSGRNQVDADYLDACRRKRNIVEYDCAGRATQVDADELIEFTKELKIDVLSWLHTEHSDLV